MSTNIIRIKRRLAEGGSGAPALSSIVNAELAFNEYSETLYYGKGGDENGADEVIEIGGKGLIDSTVSAASGNLVSLLSGVSAGLDGRVDTLEGFKTHIEGLTGSGSLTEGQIPVVGADGKLSTLILPALAITDTYVVSSYAAVQALTVEKGDVAIVNDTDTNGMLSKSFIFDGSTWQELKTPLDAKIDQLSGQLTTAISNAVANLQSSGIDSLTAAIDSLTATNSITVLGSIASQDADDVTISGGSISVSALTVTQGTALFANVSTSGSVTIGNGLTVESGAATLASTLGVSGAASLGSSLDVTGAATLASTLGVSGAATLGSSLGVTGAATLASTLGVSGAATLGSSLDVTGAATLASTLGVSGAATLGSSLDVTGAVTMSDSLSVTGPVTISGNLSGAAVYNLSGFNCYFDAGSY